MNRGNLNSSSHHHDSMWFLVIIWINFSQEFNAIFLPYVTIKRIAWFGHCKLYFEMYFSLIYFSFLWKKKHWEWLIYYLSQPFSSIYKQMKIYVFPFIVVYERTNLRYYLRTCLICSLFSATVIAYWKQFIVAFKH